MPIIGFGSFGVGGSSYINGVVSSSADLPVTLGTPPLDSVYLAKSGSGVWLINRKPAGLYVRVANNGNASDWTYLGAFPEVNADGNWELYNSTDPTKELKFDVSGVSTGTTRTLAVPDKDGTIMLVDDPIKHIVYNNSGTAIQKGKAVYLYGSQGQRTTIRLADNASDLTSARTFAITSEAIADNASGFVTTEGVIEQVNTSGFADGTMLWLGSNGNFVSTRPTQPLHGVFLGVVVKGNSVGGGSIFVKTQNGQELDELHDVLISSPSANQVLARNSGNTLWSNKTLTSSDVGAIGKRERFSIQFSTTSTTSVPARRHAWYQILLSSNGLTGGIVLPRNAEGALDGDIIILDTDIGVQAATFTVNAGYLVDFGGGPTLLTLFSLTDRTVLILYFDGPANTWKADVISRHPASRIEDSTTAGRALLTAATTQAQRDALDIFVSVANFASLPTPGVTVSQGGSVYITNDNGKVYAWNGASYTEISPNTHTRVGSNNTFVNDSALTSASLSGSDNTAVGADALNGNTAGSYNTAVGTTALRYSTTANYNTAIGYASMSNNAVTGTFNTGVGIQACRDNSGGTQNTAAGAGALRDNTTGQDNTAVGFTSLVQAAGNYNTAIGSQAGDTIVTGASNTIVGRAADVDSGARNKCVVLGASAVSPALDGTLTIGGASFSAMDNLITSTAPTGATSYLRIWLNGTEYRILLTLP
jgi:hypothetical protein